MSAQQAGEPAESPVRRPLKVTLNQPDPAACRAAAREDRDYWNDLYDHEPEDEE